MATCTVSTQAADEGEAGAGPFAMCFGGRQAGSLSHVFNRKWCYGNTWIINSLTPKGISHGGPTPEQPSLHPDDTAGLTQQAELWRVLWTLKTPQLLQSSTIKTRPSQCELPVLRVCTAPRPLGRSQGRGDETKAGEHRAPLGCSQLVSLQSLGTAHPS